MGRPAYEVVLAYPEPRTFYDGLPLDQRAAVWQSLTRIEADPWPDGRHKFDVSARRAVYVYDADPNWRIAYQIPSQPGRIVILEIEPR